MYNNRRNDYETDAVEKKIYFCVKEINRERYIYNIPDLIFFYRYHTMRKTAHSLRKKDVGIYLNNSFLFDKFFLSISHFFYRILIIFLFLLRYTIHQYYTEGLQSLKSIGQFNCAIKS